MTDDYTYYSRLGPSVLTKKKAIRDFVLARNDIRGVLDIGCNNGAMSYQFLEHGLEVLGLDISADLRIPNGYKFARCDITKTQLVIINHCTLFLSLYHHILCGNGLGVADDVFYQLLLRTNYLLFDCGNVLEQGSDRERWIQSLKTYFATEKELLRHFGVKYAPIGVWTTAGAARTIVAFERKAFDQGVAVIDEFRRGIGKDAQGRGLTSIRVIDGGRGFYPYTSFYKLRLGRKVFFAKKHRRIRDQRNELKKLIEVYAKFPVEYLLKFYGVSARFGLIYEWIENLVYKGKLRAATIRGVHLHDADIVEVNGQPKVIDFYGSFD